VRLQTARVPEIGLKVAGKPANSRLNPRINSNWPHQHVPKWLKQTFPSIARRAKRTRTSTTDQETSMTIRINVNGKTVEVKAEADTPLL